MWKGDKLLYINENNTIPNVLKTENDWFFYDVDTRPYILSDTLQRREYKSKVQVELVNEKSSYGFIR